MNGTFSFPATKRHNTDFSRKTILFVINILVQKKENFVMHLDYCTLKILW